MSNRRKTIKLAELFLDGESTKFGNAKLVKEEEYLDVGDNDRIIVQTYIDWWIEAENVDIQVTMNGSLMDIEAVDDDSNWYSGAGVISEMEMTKGGNIIFLGIQGNGELK
ncbi:hypothetical protein GCM10007063_05700 [Lentibacillus kapialis]|uniref:Uncharacterized protein n=1 Tax=Lentibacillus kapialis TaxID=340214 RepID=A0A917PNB8_9BACI|nr:hypothetical protein [Lentibacillus kapialis]GGJ86057.1 hypothetical protein GCM10007063_05700 [Lentibacillus kapialis]